MENRDISLSHLSWQLTTVSRVDLGRCRVTAFHMKIAAIHVLNLFIRNLIYLIARIAMQSVVEILLSLLKRLCVA